MQENTPCLDENLVDLDLSLSNNLLPHIHLIYKSNNDIENSRLKTVRLHNIYVMLA